MNMTRTCLALGLAWGLLPSAAFGLDAIADLRWCPGSRACLQWSASADADHYNLYRGAPSQLAALLGSETDGCTLGSYATSTTGAFVDTQPDTGEAQWYLVGVVGVGGTESTGEATSGPRSVDSSGACQSGASLLLNEVDYDQPGADSLEFVEVFNAGPDPVDLAELVLILVNGSTQAEYHRVALAEAAASLQPGGYLVVGAAGLQSVVPAGTPFADLGTSVQNGAPDGVALFDAGAEVLLDALSYEGAIHAATFDGIGGTFDLVEGTATPLADSNAEPGALIRYPDGTDTGDDATDWSFTALPTPGSANPTP